MADVSARTKVVAKTAAAAFGGRPTVTRFWDDDHHDNIDILSCEDGPEEGVTAYSTVGLSDWPLYYGDEEYHTRLEMVGACGSNFQGYDNALASAAFNVISSGWFCCPGAIYPDVLALYASSTTMKHFLFVPPFPWEEELQTLHLDDRTIAWLLALPISDEERTVAESNGSEALENLFEERQIDIFDLERPSVV
ncbi:MAG TPA: suppressor of fused domain protein [Acidimicrobiales bacterium]|nr:suppressor of fused domain protein [Acidimicrobiales bacterium]